jgi:heme/copper-type cytochrome/quinol oxidase subunit 2
VAAAAGAIVAAVAAAAGATGTDVTPLLIALSLVTIGSGNDPWGTGDEAPETLELVASEKGFEPRVINLRKGDPVRLRLTTADREHCFELDAFRVEKRVLPGRVTVVDLTPEKAGTFAFQCCIEEGAAADKEHGRLVVVE